MIRGITPIDSAFEIMGQIHAQMIIHYIFVESWVGRIVFTLGFLLSFAAAIGKGNFKSVAFFVLIFLIVWFLLVLPQIKKAEAISAMEAHGYKKEKAADILKKQGINTSMVNPVLEVVLRFIDGVIVQTGALMDKKGYLSHPFGMFKTSLLIRERIEEGITDKKLQRRAVYFYQDHVWPLMRNNPAASLWAGDAVNIAAYTLEGKKLWEELRNDLYAMLDADHAFEEMYTTFYDGKVEKDAPVKDLLLIELKRWPRLYTHMSYPEQEKGTVPVRGQSPSAPSAVAGASAGLSVLKFFEYIPYIHGTTIYWLLLAWPFFLTASLLLRQVAVCISWVVGFSCVKAWTLGWIALDQVVSSWMLGMMEQQRYLLWQARGVEVFAVIGVASIVLSTVMMMLVLPFWVRRSLV